MPVRRRRDHGSFNPGWTRESALEADQRRPARAGTPTGRFPHEGGSTTTRLVRLGTHRKNDRGPRRRLRTRPTWPSLWSTTRSAARVPRGWSASVLLGDPVGGHTLLLQ